MAVVIGQAVKVADRARGLAKQRAVCGIDRQERGQNPLLQSLGEDLPSRRLVVGLGQPDRAEVVPDLVAPQWGHDVTVVEACRRPCGPRAGRRRRNGATMSPSWRLAGQVVFF